MLKRSMIMGSVLLGAATVAQAASVNATYYANSLLPLVTTDFGTGHKAPTAGNIAPAGYGSSSFYASVDKNTANRYSTFRLNLGSVAGRTVTIADLVSFSYLTQTVGTLDWRVSIYTAAGSNPAPNLGGFSYESRLQATPAANGAAGAWTTRSSANLLFYESNIGGQTGTWSWDSLRAGTVTASPTNNTRNFSGERIAYIDFTLGANSGGGTQAGYLDGLSFLLSNGDTISVNLEGAPTVPLPGAALAGVALFAKLGLTRRRLI